MYYSAKTNQAHSTNIIITPQHVDCLKLEIESIKLLLSHVYDTGHKNSLMRLCQAKTEGPSIQYVTWR